ncbi:MAG: NBR1-Ig-like domain-containing protein [Anaerolineales bacterium]
MKSIRLVCAVLAIVFFLSACNLPGGNSAEQVQTAAAETVNAQLTSNALLTPSSTNTPEPTATEQLTNTPAVTNTLPPTSASGGGGGCDAMQFVTDVTVPDGEQRAPSATFVKTWRLRNSGTCTWTTTYSVVFVSGNAMGGPAAQALTGSIVPGSTVDISVNLTAPSTGGKYTGYWALRNASGQNFGSFFVEINVTGSGSGSSGGNTFAASQVGRVDANGNVSSQAYAGSSAGVGVRGFVSFDISGIPTGSTIQEVKVDFSGFDTVSNPFTMGCLQAYAGVYFPLDAASYSSSGSGPDIEWCSSVELSTAFVDNEVKTRLQSSLGSSTLQYQLRFTGAPSGDRLVRFLNGGVNLIITYIEP